MGIDLQNIYNIDVMLYNGTLKVYITPHKLESFIKIGHKADIDIYFKWNGDKLSFIQNIIITKLIKRYFYKDIIHHLYYNKFRTIPHVMSVFNIKRIINLDNTEEKINEAFMCIYDFYNMFRKTLDYYFKDDHRLTFISYYVENTENPICDLHVYKYNNNYYLIIEHENIMDGFIHGMIWRNIIVDENELLGPLVIYYNNTKINIENMGFSKVSGFKDLDNIIMLKFIHNKLKIIPYFIKAFLKKLKK